MLPTDAAVGEPTRYLEPQRLSFTGAARDYFGIWIVNLILTILTLGIYSAWAKVRRISYFHSNTMILGDRLAYHATGWMILKGRLIAFAVIAVLTFSSFINPLLQLVLYLAIIPAIPWVINQSLRFQARMTSWRNVRFNWTGTYGEAFKVTLLWPIAAFLSVGILLPMWRKASHDFIARNLKFGETPFSADLSAGPYYKVLGMALLLGAPVFIAIGGFNIWMFATLAPTGNSGSMPDDPLLAVVMFFVIGLSAIWLFALQAFYQIRTRNLLVNALRIKDVAAFSTDMRTRRIIWITVTNTLVIPLTLFLMLPWAVVRLYRYTVESTLIAARETLPDFADEKRDDKSAFGEEFGSMEGIDISI